MRTGHRKWLLPATVLGGIALICFPLCLRTGQAGVMSPAQALSNLITWARLSIARALQLPLYLEREELIAAHPYYLETIARSKNTLMTFLSGAILALSGAVCVMFTVLTLCAGGRPALGEYLVFMAAILWLGGFFAVHCRGWPAGSIWAC